MYTIKELLEENPKEEKEVSIDEVNGTIGYVGKPNRISGTKNGKSYSFLSQFIVIKDGEYSIGASITPENENSITSKEKDMSIKLTKCKLIFYEKDGKLVPKLERGYYSLSIQTEQKETLEQRTNRINQENLNKPDRQEKTIITDNDKKRYDLRSKIWDTVFMTLAKDVSMYTFEDSKENNVLLAQFMKRINDIAEIGYKFTTESINKPDDIQDVKERESANIAEDKEEFDKYWGNNDK